jgi:hypothetical protein
LRSGKKYARARFSVVSPYTNNFLKMIDRFALMVYSGGIKSEGGAEMKVITNAMLGGACREQRAVFRKEWPDGAPVTVRAALRAVALGLDLEWLASKLFPSSLWAEYERQEAPLWAEYERQEARILVPLLRKVKVEAQR